MVVVNEVRISRSTTDCSRVTGVRWSVVKTWWWPLNAVTARFKVGAVYFKVVTVHFKMVTVPFNMVSERGPDYSPSKFLRVLIIFLV